jgi:hypothetical protein
MAKDFIQKAIGGDAGAFTKKAKQHGETVSQFADEVLSNKEDFSTKTERQANLAKTLAKVRKYKGKDRG